MPTIGVKRDLLFKALGRVYTDEQFNDLCFEYGLELDEVTTEKQMISKEQGSDKSQGASDDVIYKIDIPANRYDLLCLEGLVQGLLIFLGKYTATKSREKVIVSGNPKKVRPFVVSAILRDIAFNDETYKSFIDLQDKLHQNVCRMRSLVSIGTHDLDTITFPVHYDARPPNDIQFIALNQKQKLSAEQLMDLYSKDSHLKPYLGIIQGKPVYPVILDSKDTVLSFPPIINSEHSKITLKTKDVFIEITATDENKASLVLDTMVCMFSQYSSNKFSCESVDVQYPDGKVKTYPELKTREEDISVSLINRRLGTNLCASDVTKLLTKMSLKSELENGDLVRVAIPVSRQDILHACDIIEDVGIAFGYNNIKKTHPNALTIGQQLPLNKITDQLRFEIARCGYTEALTFALCSREDISEKLLNSDGLDLAVTISNPKTLDFQVARTTLMPGILKTVAANKKMPLPIKIFEISDVVYKDPKKETGACNERRLCAINYNKTPGFEVVHGLLDRIMQVLDIPSDAKNGYSISPVADGSFFAGRCAQIFLKGSCIGIMGVLHPAVIKNFELVQPASLLDISVEELTTHYLIHNL